MNRISSLRIFGAIVILASPPNAFGIGVTIGNPESLSYWKAGASCDAMGGRSQNPMDLPYTISVFVKTPDGAVTTSNKAATLDSDTTWRCDGLVLAASDPPIGPDSGSKQYPKYQVIAAAH